MNLNAGVVTARQNQQLIDDFVRAADPLEAAGPGEEPDPERLARLREMATQSSTTPEPTTG